MEFNCKYDGERSPVGTMDGKGEFTFPNGTKYVGEFVDGEFHGNGTLYLPGRGRYEAVWDHGKVVSGKMFFEDNLEFQNENWFYCAADDRRFANEVTNGLNPAGKSFITPTRQESSI